MADTMTRQLGTNKSGAEAIADYFAVVPLRDLGNLFGDC